MVKDKTRVRESINLRNDEDIEIFKQFLFLISTKPSFLEIPKDGWQKNKFKSMALRNHMESYVCKHDDILSAKAGEYGIFSEEYDKKEKNDGGKKGS